MHITLACIVGVDWVWLMKLKFGQRRPCAELSDTDRVYNIYLKSHRGTAQSPLLTPLLNLHWPRPASDSWQRHALDDTLRPIRLDLREPSVSSTHSLDPHWHPAGEVVEIVIV